LKQRKSRKAVRVSVKSVRKLNWVTRLRVEARLMLVWYWQRLPRISNRAFREGLLAVSEIVYWWWRQYNGI